ncbi:MAG TPA: enoyl-CoA hydratase-related protein [Jatrophihabitantaceae bacterium]|nr:enoyl-CoA hydratase-related protein [Jatrophihabitantaceae bacterium]
MATLDRDAEVFVLNLGDDENRFHPSWLDEVAGHLNTVAGTEGPCALVTTASGKFFSNGLDLDWLRDNSSEFVTYVIQVHRLFERVLALPVPTVAAVQGHAFAGGAMLALAHDFRVMRADRGFLCLPEVDINIPFSRGMSALIQSKLTPKTAHEAMTTGRRYGGTDALGAGIVDAVAHEDDVVSSAIEIARPLAAKAGATLGTIKARMYPAALDALRDTQTPLD